MPSEHPASPEFLCPSSGGRYVCNHIVLLQSLQLLQRRPPRFDTSSEHHILFAWEDNDMAQRDNQILRQAGWPDLDILGRGHFSLFPSGHPALKA